jgi:hypothetical protein
MKNVILVTVAITVVVTMVMSTPLFLMTTTAAYAQSSNSRACPDGFAMNRGVCTKPADETTITSGPTCPDNTWQLTQDLTKCFKNAVVPTGYHVFPADEGVDTDEECQQLSSRTDATYDPNTNTCRFPSFTVTTIYEDSIPGKTTTNYSCTQGILNEDSRMCETRPGNRT